MKDLAFGRDTYKKAAKRKTAQSVGLKEDLKEAGKSVKRTKNKAQHKLEMELFRLKHHSEMMERDRKSRGSVETEKNNPLKLPIKKPIPIRTQSKSHMPVMDKAARQLAISKYQGDRDLFTGKRPHKKRYF